MKPMDISSVNAPSYAKERTDKIRRFSATERLFHWSFALPQIVLMITGGWLLAIAALSGENTVKTDLVIIHKMAAACFILAPVLIFMNGNAKVLIKNIMLALTWSRKDFQWLYLSFLKLVIPSTRLPEAGKFNAGQKLNMLLAMTLGGGFIISGLFMWFLDGVLLAWFIHAASFLFVLFMVSGHIYMAILHPSTRPSFWAIINGNVDRNWACHHHSQWAENLEENSANEDNNS